MCLESKENKIMAAICNPGTTSQIFKSKLLYTIDKFCTFKQGPYGFLNSTKWIIANNGYFVNGAQCLTYNNVSLSFSLGNCNNLDFQKWIYTEDGQIMNNHENACLNRDNNTITLNTCDLNLKSQRWICA